ncbi:cysteine hydrolase [Kosmotoga arenicorallina S304]|uniref:Cysteine hydrolase n=1 Tax=Kosmotoga arenicorallina S304 TaxID=1453497 RepID=A0A176K162_9BACT|nr:isochorismatase family cysteine hydrolase [Kosmotoga arenicorallina]OAA30626.1 cysteine hydrolase [Kosmotoga arenicorallina S304]
MKALLIVDIQNDFVKPTGTLYSNGVEGIIPNILSLVEMFKKEGVPIITTMDWHKVHDPEFEKWPPHCVEKTEGAALIMELDDSLKNYEKHYTIKKRKYSAFFDTNFEGLLKSLNIEEIHVVGVATNICVLFTVEELCNREYKVVVHEKGTASYDEKLHRFALREMKEVLGVEIL